MVFKPKSYKLSSPRLYMDNQLLKYTDDFEISEATLGTSVRCFSNYLKTQFVKSYSNICNINDCVVCNNSN